MSGHSVEDSLYTKAVSNMAVMDINVLLRCVNDLLIENGIFVFATQHRKAALQLYSKLRRNLLKCEVEIYVEERCYIWEKNCQK